MTRTRWSFMRCDDDGSDSDEANGEEAVTEADNDSEHERDGEPAMVGDKFAPKKGRAGRKRIHTDGGGVGGGIGSRYAG